MVPDYAVNRYSILSAEQVSSTSVAVNVIFQPGADAEERQKLIFAVRDKTRRTIFNQTDGGSVQVKDGIAVARGARPRCYASARMAASATDTFAPGLLPT